VANDEQRALMAQQILHRIRAAVLEGRYRLSEHALNELDDDRLTYVDAEAALLNGLIVRVQPPQDRPGERYTVVGHACDLATKVAVVCRFDEEQDLLIITVIEVVE
jgi:hypothetical protein